MIEIALVAQALLWLTLLAGFLASRQASLFHPALVYLFFHGLVFVLRPILVYSFGFDTSWKYMVFQPTEEYYVQTLAVSSVGLLSFFIACLWAGWSRCAFSSGEIAQFSALERRALLVTTLLLFPIAAFSIYATKDGIAGERINGIYVMTNSTGYLNEAQHVIMPLLCAWLVMTRFHRLNLLPILLYLGYRAWLGWSRWTILLFLLMSVLTYCWFYRKKWLPLWSLIVAVPILMIFNLLGHNRDVLKQVLLGEQVQLVQHVPGRSERDKLKEQLDTQDYANFDYLSYIVSVVPERTGRYTYGSQYLQLFTEPIPRILWKGKPVGAPVKTINIGAYGNFIGLTVSLCGDGWVSGGWIGLIITLSLAGGLLGYAHRRFWEKNCNSFFAMFYIVILAMVPQWYRDGGISIAKFLLFTLWPVLIWQGMKWLLSQRLVPAYSVLLPERASVRLIDAPDLRPKDGLSS